MKREKIGNGDGVAIADFSGRDVGSTYAEQKFNQKMKTVGNVAMILGGVIVCLCVVTENYFIACSASIMAAAGVGLVFVASSEERKIKNKRKLIRKLANTQNSPKNDSANNN